MQRNRSLTVKYPISVFLVFAFFTINRLDAQFQTSTPLESGCVGVAWSDTIRAEDSYDVDSWADITPGNVGPNITSYGGGSGILKQKNHDEPANMALVVYILEADMLSIVAQEYSFYASFDEDPPLPTPPAKEFRFTINPSPSITAYNVTDVSCFGGNDGAIDITVSGGTIPYSYEWDNGDDTEDISSLTAGAYAVTITDVKSCKASGSYPVNQPADLPDADVTPQNVTCYGGSDGSIGFSNVSGGTSPYQFSADGGGSWQTTASITGLSKGNYNVQIKDAKECTVVLDPDLSIDEPAQLNATVNTTDANCGDNGVIRIENPSGGTNGYQYSITTTTTDDWGTDNEFTGLAPDDYTVKIRDAAYTGCERTLADPAGINFTPQPVDLMLVLDLSGSMLSHMPSGADKSKLQVLEEAVKVFLDQWQTWKNTETLDHRIGLTYFKEDVYSFEVTADPPPLRYLRTDTNDMALFLTGLPTVSYDLTAMGGGIQNALNLLTRLNTHEKILLFTDGMQNVNPLVDPVSLKIQNGSASANSNIPEDVPPADLNEVENIFAVGVGLSTSNTSYEELLKKISHEDANAFFTMDANTFLDNFFTADWAYIMGCNSPRLIDYRYGNLAGSSAEEVFSVSDNVDKIMFKLVGDRGDGLDFRLYKDGVEIPPGSGSVSHQDFYKLFLIRFPLIVNGQAVNAGGDWTMKISGNDGSSYKSAAFENESELNFNCAISSMNHRIGDTIKLHVSLDYAGREITEGCDVKAIILKPGEDLGDMLARIRIPDKYFIWEKDGERPVYNILPPEQVVFESGMQPGHKKFEVLMNDPGFFASFRESGNEVTLHNNADGTYSGNYTNTNVTGPYRIVFQVFGSSTGIGRINRIVTKSTVVNYAVIQRSLSDLYVIHGTGTRNPTQISLRPRDSSGLLIGPVYEDIINVTLSDGSVGPLRNKLDGRYSALLNVPANSDPVITVKVFDDSIYNGKLSGLEEKYSIGLTGTYSLPVSSFANAFSGGPGAAIDFEWKFKKPFSLDILAGYSSFDPDYGITGGTAFLQYVPAATIGGFMPYAGAGAGLYKPKSMDLSPGLAGKIGFKRRLAGPRSINRSLRMDFNHLWLDINAMYHTLFVPNNDRNYLSIGIGLRYSF